MTNHTFTTDRVARIDSDREVLPFPSGGVFGHPAPLDADTTVRELERTLSTMQRQLNELGRAVDDVLRFTEYVDDDSSDAPTPPSAA